MRLVTVRLATASRTVPGQLRLADAAASDGAAGSGGGSPVDRADMLENDAARAAGGCGGLRMLVRGGLVRGGVRAPRRRPGFPSRRLGAGQAAAAVVEQLARAGGRPNVLSCARTSSTLKRAQ